MSLKIFTSSLIVLLSFSLSAQYAPAADQEETTAIHMDSSIIVSWASGYENYIVGDDVDPIWQQTYNALGKAQGTSGAIVCLGRGGQITFTFDTLIVNKEGPDFVTFENSFKHTFLELGWVEVSMDGINFERFPNYSNTSSSISAFGDLDPSKIHGYCSKYKQGYGTPFELDSVSIDTVRYVRLIDIVGNGTALDTDGNIIYDPYPTTGSAGLDIDAIGVIHAGNMVEGIEELNEVQVKVYPNPAQNYFVIDGLDQKVLSCEIYDLTGKLVKTFDTPSSEYRVDDIVNGLYYIKLRTEGTYSSTKLIISH